MRLIHVFPNELELAAPDFSGVEPEATGRPSRNIADAACPNGPTACFVGTTRWRRKRRPVPQKELNGQVAASCLGSRHALIWLGAEKSREAEYRGMADRADMASGWPGAAAWDEIASGLRTLAGLRAAAAAVAWPNGRNERDSAVNRRHPGRPGANARRSGNRQTVLKETAIEVYRLRLFDELGNLLWTARIAHCDTDDEATNVARMMMGGCPAVEVGSGGRLVCRLTWPPKPPVGPLQPCGVTAH